MKSYEKVDIKKLDKSRVEITGSIAAPTWEAYRAEAFKHINNSVTIDGFRKGNVPENVLISKVGDMAILEEMAELALSRAYVDIIVDNKIDAIGRPEIHITKIAKGNPLEFRIVTAVVPTVTLPDYSKIAADIVAKNDPSKATHTDKELDEAVNRLRTNLFHANNERAGLPYREVKTEDLPELTDDMVKGFGIGAETVAEFKIKVGEMLLEQKRDEARDKRRIMIADAIAEKSSVETPDILVDSEVHRIEAQFQADIERMGVKLDDYLKHSKKSIEDLRIEWRGPAEKKAKLQLIVNAIAQKEKIAPVESEIEHEVGHILEHYKDADREKAHAYAETVLTNEKVFQFLETGKMPGLIEHKH